MQHAETYFIGPGNQLQGGARRGHWCAVPRNDGDGPRALTVPQRQYNLIKKGMMSHGMAGVDELGKQYSYCADRDLWIADKLRRVQRLRKPSALGGVIDHDEFGDEFSGGLGAYGINYDEFGSTDLMTYPFSGWRERRAKRKKSRSSRRKKRRAKVRKFFKRVGKGFRKVLAKIMNSKWVQNAIAGILQAYGVPTKLTKGVLAAGASIIKQGGISGFIRLLRKDKKAAMRMIAQAGKAGLKGAGIDAPAEWCQ